MPSGDGHVFLPLDYVAPAMGLLLVRRATRLACVRLWRHARRQPISLRHAMFAQTYPGNGVCAIILLRTEDAMGPGIDGSGRALALRFTQRTSAGGERQAGQLPMAVCELR